jgi:5-methylcytosine-specific restriction endonuclease McrA
MLDEPVLVLNRSWVPLQVANVRRIMRLLFCDRAMVVCPDTFRIFDFDGWVSASLEGDERCLHTPNFQVRVPEVAVLASFNRTVRRRIRFNRRNVMERDDQTCQYCGVRLPERELTLEHIYPSSKGGPNTWENVVIACRQCNRRKGNRTPAEAGMALLRQPAAPKKLYSTMPRLGRLRPAWRPFLGNLQPA